METPRPPAAFRFATPPHIVIIEARFYDKIAAMQLQGARQALTAAPATHDIVRVPGALEIPAAIAFYEKAASDRKADGYIALGCVIKGGTMHDEIVATESTRGLQELALHHALAIGNGILTCNTMDQAEERADPARGNRGCQAAAACLRMIEIQQQLRLSKA